MTRSRNALLAFAGLALFLAAWQAAVATGLLPRTLVPPPSAVPPAWLREIQGGFWTAAVRASLGHYALGLLCGSAGGVAFGLATALSPRFDALTGAVARLLRPIPPLAWIPFALIWFGATEGAAAFIIAIGVFWVNVFATSAAVRAIDPGLLELAAAFGQGRLVPRVTKFILPGAASGLLAGLRAGLGQGWMAVVAAELFGVSGIGQRMSDAAGLLATDVLIVYMLTIALLYAVSDAVFVQASRRILAWAP